ncbi:MAG: site-specific integrase [Rhodospirillaceae bacterium]
MKAAITNKLLREMKTPPDGRRNQVIFDTVVKGFIVDIRASTQTYSFIGKKKGGITKQIKLGRNGDITIEQARRRARELRAEFDLGLYTEGDSKIVTSKLTYGKFLEDRYFPHQRARNRGWKEAERLMRRRVMPTLGPKLISRITEADCDRLYSGVITEGRTPATANRVLAGLKHSLGIAVRWGVIDKNPSMSVKAVRENNLRARYLTPAEITAVVQALRSDHDQVAAAAIMLLLLTGARSGEILGARWDEVDVERKLWVIPRPKGGRALHRPLHPCALGILSSLPHRETEPFIFSRTSSGKPRSLRAVWERTCRKVGLEKVRIHDLRHTYASLLVDSGESLYTVQKLLGHSTNLVTQRYAHLSMRHLSDANGVAAAPVLAAFQDIIT